MTPIETLVYSNEACNLCPLSGKEACCPLGGRALIKKSFDYFAIEFKPTAEDDLIFDAFSDRTGQLGRKIFHELSIDAHYTYLVRCFHTGKMPISDIKICRDNWLKKEIDLVKPKILFIFGKNTASKLLNKIAIEFGETGWYNSDTRFAVCYSLQQCLNNKNYFEKTKDIIKKCLNS